MHLKKTVTSLAVDSARAYLHERLEKLKQLDLDQDGQKDVDQLAELVTQAGEKMKTAIDATDFQKLAAGIDQFVAGAETISSSFDREKVGQACSEFGPCMRQVGKLLKLAVAEVKTREAGN